MNFEKIKFSKCPNCKKHGIPGVVKAGKSPYKLTCKYCGKSYKMNAALVVFINILTPIFVVLICISIENYIKLPFLLWAAITLVLHGLIMYFAPLEEVDE